MWRAVTIARYRSRSCFGSISCAPYSARSRPRDALEPIQALVARTSRWNSLSQLTRRLNARNPTTVAARPREQTRVDPCPNRGRRAANETRWATVSRVPQGGYQPEERSGREARSALAPSLESLGNRINLVRIQVIGSLDWLLGQDDRRNGQSFPYHSSRIDKHGKAEWGRGNRGSCL